MSNPGRRRVLQMVLGLPLLPPGVAGQEPAGSRGQKDVDAAATPLIYQSDKLEVQLRNSSQTVARLSPKGSSFDFTPGDRLSTRSSPGYHHLGDISIRVRFPGTAWRSFSSALRPSDVKPIPGRAQLCAADLTPALGEDCPASIQRYWDHANEALRMRFAISNRGAAPLEIGSLGMPMVFNNDLTGRSLKEAHEHCSFSDAYVGGTLGYLQVTRLNGEGPVLLVIPEAGTGFEAYRLLTEEPTKQGVTFEGFYEWMVHTKAYTEAEWPLGKQWNLPTSKVLNPGESAEYGLRFCLAPSIRDIDGTLYDCGHPTTIGVPGYLLAEGEAARLFVRRRAAVRSVIVEPPTALEIARDAKALPNEWREYSVRAVHPGDARLTVTYEDGRSQHIHYKVIAGQERQIASFRQCQLEKQYFDDRSDPFGRAGAFMPIDRQTGEMLTQESRVYIVGLSDEAGAGANLAMAMANLADPQRELVSKLEKYVDACLWGHLQGSSDYGVKASLFYYDRKEFPNYYTIPNGCWDKERSFTTWRAYNYPHQAAIYWVLYRLARNYSGLVTRHDWKWYLRQSYRTGLAIREHCGPKAFLFLAQYGLMVGSVFVEILEDLRREGWAQEADEFEGYMRQRADIWSNLEFPFGSEMPWDSTGQEEVYCWCKHFGLDAKADITVKAITAYMPAIPSWGYNGSARRYFDSFVYGKWDVIGREFHHYGSSLNAIPVLSAFREDPADFHLLRIGYAGMLGPLANIDEKGQASMCFMGLPSIMDFEPYSGDFGQAFYGHMYASAAYVMKHPEFGWIGFGCEVTDARRSIRIVPKDSCRNRMYFAPAGAWVTLESGRFEEANWNEGDKILVIRLAPATAYLRTARLRIEHPGAKKAQIKNVSFQTTAREFRGAYEIELGHDTTEVQLRAV